MLAPFLAFLLTAATPSAQTPAPSPVPKELVRETWPDGRAKVEREVASDGKGGIWNDGAYREWHENGQLAAEGSYSKGARNGEWKSWYGNGQIQSKGRYAKDRLAGKWEFWNDAGVEDFDRTGKYEFARELCIDGKAFAEGYFVDGRRHGEWTFWWSEGIKLFEGRFRNGLYEGDWVAWHRDGSVSTILLSGRYDGGKLVGDLDPARVASAAREASARAAEGTPAKGAPAAWIAAALDGREGFDAGRDPERMRDVARALAALDLSLPESQARAQRLDEFMRVYAQRHHFGPLARKGQPFDVERAAEIARGWHSLVELTADDAVFWNLDLAASWNPATDEASPVLRTPTLLRSDRERDAKKGIEIATYAQRFERRGSSLGKMEKEVSRAVGDALAWLAAHQSPEGGWDCDGFMGNCGRIGESACDGPGESIHDVGVTGLALLAFLGEGHTPIRGEHAATISSGLAWLVSQQDAESGFIGEVAGGSLTYGHAIATYALAEARALTGHECFRDPLERAVAWILRAQNPYAAWRYDYPPNGDNDTSITSWMMCALHAAELAGVTIDRVSLQNARNWLDEVTDAATGRCGYYEIGSVSARVPKVNDHFPPEKGEALTAAALVARMLCGERPDSSPMLEKGADLLRAKPPKWDPDGLGIDTYYWYYASQALHLLGDKPYWDIWWKAMAATAIDSQREDGDTKGSWDSQGDAWGLIGGRVYTTSMMALCLEAPYRLGAPPQKKK